MTSDEKARVARFLDLLADLIGSGYRGPEREYRFEGEARPGEAACPAAGSETPGAAPPRPARPAGGETGGAEDGGLESTAAGIRACRACSLCETRVKAVPGEGAERPLVLVIGEGPGAEEDAAGRPFIGRAGQLLDKMLASIGLSRESNCFIANVVKCRPPGNRDPLPEEIAACAPFLERQIRLLRPKIILCAGKVAAQALLETGRPVGELRGVLHSVSRPAPIPLVVTYHPSALLRNEAYKRPAWEDLKMLRAKLSEAAPGEAGPAAPEAPARGET
ncbi:MAG: uracil-DNA glycosylase [Treponema sp.]|jgi:DNA polymerase|nr:uracil-DNA glycosylase [Treponema sp.]